MGNLQRTSYRFSFVDVTLQVDALFDVVHSAKNWRSRHCTSHAWCSALIEQRTETVLYHTLPGNSGVRFFGEIHRLLAFGFSLRHGDLKWLKTEVVWPGSDAYERELNRTLRLVSWLKRERRLAVAQPTSQTQKGTRTTGCWRIWCPHERMGSKIIFFFFFWGRA